MEEKKYFKISLGTAILIAIIVILIIALVGMYFYYNSKNDSEKTDNKNSVDHFKENTVNFNNTTIEEHEISDENVENPYKNYDNLNWYFNDEKFYKNKTLNDFDEYFTDYFAIENGFLYIIRDGKKEKIDSITEEIKDLATWWNGGELTRLYVLTQNGNIYRLGKDTDYEYVSYKLRGSDNMDEFYKINLPDKVINMTDGDSSKRITEAPYFLLANGNLINEEGSRYEELEGNFIRSYGTIEGTIFEEKNNTIYEYNYGTRKYSQIKDTNGKPVKIKEVFIQWCTSRNNLLEEMEHSTDRIFLRTDDNKLLYFDGYENVTAKEYKDTEGKIIKNAVEEEIPDEYGGHSTNIRIIFSDGTEVTLIDAYKPNSIN